MTDPPDELRAALEAKGWRLGEQIGMASAGTECDAAAASVYMMPDGSSRCRCTVCPRCGHHTGNSHQGHYWGFCKVTRTVREPHFCCIDPAVGCELEARETLAQEIREATP